MYFNFVGTDSEATAAQKAYEEKFSEYGDDVDGAFIYLLSKLEALWSEVDHHTLKKVCIRDTRLSDNLRRSIKDAPKLDEVFDLLKSSPYLTWFEIRILQRMANMAEITEAKCLIKCYEKYAFSKPCSAVMPYFYKQYIIPDHLTEVVAKLNVNSDRVKVSDLIVYCHRLDSVVGLPTGSTTLVNNKKGCLELSAIIPVHYSFHAYNKAKSLLLKLRSLHIQYLQVGSFSRIYAVDLTNSEEDQLLLENVASSSCCCKLYALPECVCMCSTL